MDLYKLRLEPNAKRLVQQLQDLGIDIETIVSNRINNLAQFAADSVISKVPVDSSELRDSHIFVEFSNPGDLTAKVFIDSKSHSSYGKRSPSRKINGKSAKADILAEFLDEESPYHRSQTSKAVNPFKPEPKGGEHEGWIEKAFFEFDKNDQYRDDLLNG